VRVWLLTNVLDSFLDTGSYVCSRLPFVFGFVLWCSRSVEICRFQGVRSTSNPASSSYPSQSLWLCLDCFARKSVMPVALCKGLLVRGSLSVLAVDPFASLEPFFYPCWLSLFIFFVIWFRVRTRVRWIVLVMSICIIMIMID
jgi:hypothetical protein